MEKSSCRVRPVGATVTYGGHNGTTVVGLLQCESYLKLK